MRETRKLLSIVFTFVFTMFTMLCSIPVKVSAKKAEVPIVQFSSAPVTEYTAGDRVQFNINSPNYGGLVEYRVILWNDSQKSYSDLWNETNGYPGRYYTRWQPTGKTIFTLGWPIFEPGTYRITVYVKRVGVAANKAALTGMNCDSYKESVAFTVKPRITFLDKEGQAYGSKDVNKLEEYKGDTKVTANNVTLSNAKVEGDLYISGDNALIKNIVATGKIIIDPGKEGSTTLEVVAAKNIEILSGGKDSIHIRNVRAENININSSTPVRIEADGDTEIVSTSASGYVIFDRRNGTYGIITITEGSNGIPVIEFRGEIHDKVEVETAAVIKTGVDSKVSSLTITTKNVTDRVELEGKFTKVEINSEVRLEVGANTRIGDIVVNKNAEINLDKTAAIDNLDKGNNSVVLSGEGTVGPVTPIVSDGGWYPPVDTTVKVNNIKLNKSVITLTVDASETLTATVEPTNASNKKITWSSSNTSIAAVDAKGKVTAVTEGTADITVTTEDGNKTAVCRVNVNPKGIQDPVVIAAEWKSGEVGIFEQPILDEDGTELARVEDVFKEYELTVGTEVISLRGATISIIDGDEAIETMEAYEYDNLIVPMGMPSGEFEFEVRPGNNKVYMATLVWAAPTPAEVSFQAPSGAEEVFTQAGEFDPASVDFSKVTADKLLDWTLEKPGYYAIELKIEGVVLSEENVAKAFLIYGNVDQYEVIEAEISGNLNAQYVTTDWKIGRITMYYVLIDNSIYRSEIDVISLTPRGSDGDITIVIHNNKGIMYDYVEVAGLNTGDIIHAYLTEDKETALEEDGSDLGVLKFLQGKLNSAGGTIYITITPDGGVESSPIPVIYDAEFAPPTEVQVITEGGIQNKITWTASTFSDVQEYYIYRENEETSEYIAVHLDKGITEFIDTTAVPGVEYVYYVIASFNQTFSWSDGFTITIDGE